MKTGFLNLLLAGFLCCAAFQTQAQSYDNMPAAVQKKIDENKKNSLDPMNGIKVDYEFTIAGVTDTQSSQVLENLLQAECGLIAYHYNPSNQHVSFTVPARVNYDVLKSVLKNKGFSFGLFFKENYYL